MGRIRAMSNPSAYPQDVALFRAVTSREGRMPLPDPAVIERSGVYDESVYDSGAVYGAEPCLRDVRAR